MTQTSPKTKALGTTALPNRLFDAWLPMLGDGELRVLLVVARSTLGWQDGTGRKARDWLSHSQLCRRTGRSNTPVSSAIDSLVRQGLLVVEDEDGQPLATAKQRRAARSRLFFRLGTALPSSENHTFEAAFHEPDAWTGATSRSSVTHVMGPSPAPSAFPGCGIHILETTKETVTNVLQQQMSFPPKRNHSPQTGTAEEIHTSETENTPKLIDAYERAYRAARPGEPVPATAEEEAALLANYLKRGYGPALEKQLPAFFACSFSFVQRRNYSLRAYLNCFFVLQARSTTTKCSPMGQRGSQK